MRITAYSKGSKFFHWLIAIVVIGMLSFSFFLENLPDQYQSTGFMIHKSLGLTVLVLIVLFFLWTQYTGKPDLPTITPKWQIILARFVQYSLYALLICMPLSGWVMSIAAGRVPSYFGLFNVPLPMVANKALSNTMQNTHETIAWILIALIALHIIGALKHHFINKDSVLKTMWRG